MKILYIITKPDHGGAQEYVLSLSRDAVEKGSSIVIATSSEGWITENARKSGIRVMLIPSLARLPLSFPLLIRECWSLLRGAPYDVIHLNSSATLLAVVPLRWFVKSRIVFTFHGLSFLNEGWNGSKTMQVLYLWLVQFCSQFLDGVIFVSRNDQDLAKKLRLVKTGLPQTVIHNGILIIDFIERKKAREMLGAVIQKDLQNDFIVGTVARLSPQKNIPLFVEIASLTQNTTFIILGSGPEKNEIAQLIMEKSLCDRVFLIDSFDEPRRYLKAFDVFLSTSRYEGLPFSILEATQANIPVVAPGIGGIPEILKETNGYLVSSNTIDEYVGALSGLREKSKDSPLVIPLNRLEEKEFTYEEMNTKTRAFYEKVK